MQFLLVLLTLETPLIVVTSRRVPVYPVQNLIARTLSPALVQVLLTLPMPHTDVPANGHFDPC